MRSSAKRLWSDQSGAIAAVYALALPALIAAGGIAFDYARLAAMDTELQNAADQAALAAATQLDGREGAIARARSAAQASFASAASEYVNETRVANDGEGRAITDLSFTFGLSTAQPVSFLVHPNGTARLVYLTAGGWVFFGGNQNAFQLSAE